MEFTIVFHGTNSLDLGCLFLEIQKQFIYEYEVLDSEISQGHIRNYDIQSLRSEIKEAGLHCLESGGVLLKTLANFQFDHALKSGINSWYHTNARKALTLGFPSLCSSLYALAEIR